MEVFVSHRHARLTVHGRQLLVERVRCGRPVTHVAAEMGISRPTAHKWLRRWRAEGEAGALHDRPSRSPQHTPPDAGSRGGNRSTGGISFLWLRDRGRRDLWGPASARPDPPPSTPTRTAGRGSPSTGSARPAALAPG
ncbi:hypothetical protein GCM10010246_83430 [Streptomyces cuspidosporus]|uniref:DNA-binding domain-containing protein n=1 Tax=Streptomyces cuspidosporus TaxID=66882 RepID=A0ABP5UEC8_9ACTN